MLGSRINRLAVAGALLSVFAAGCGTHAGSSPPPSDPPEALSSSDPFPVGQLEGNGELAPAPAPSKPSAKPSATVKKVNPGGDTGGQKANTNDGVPNLGSGTFTVAAGGTDLTGSADAGTLVKYRVEMENGIQWGANPVWTTDKLATEVDRAISAPLGWTASAAHPVTYAPNKISGASWKFQRVSGADYSVTLKLATPGTVDKLCKAVGVTTQGIYSCRYGKTILLNLRRWLKGIDGFPAGIDFHAMTVLHEMGHFLGFDHMKCPGSGQVAPVMQTQTIALNGCTPNAFPFTEAGTFVSGPWASS
ncbi:DUF3152 domain-containing protein [Dactylosporangium matsuzakiense]|uniref:Membrane protein n=1 Tax=Dactylosporangium matsuzakiense TaxID=53360 RepID=A0A9W6NJX5_9ACTN|nr:DUF3152 domain-containing protein [Dactylosporangium matsuzakiense]GLL00385.1 membrane protein [Dactylosporangium matsuzakiense]